MIISDKKLILEILHFWFGKDPKNPLSQQTKWWKKDPSFDEEIRVKFSEAVTQARAGTFESWGETANGALALIILLDQFPRNLFRGSADAFTSDKQALSVSKQAIARGLDQKLSPEKRWFLYMPLMHSESAEMQKFSLKLYQTLSQEGDATLKSSLQATYDFAKRHAEIIFRFGRYPHRNAVLGRKSTAAEMEFLQQPGSSF